MLTNAAKILSKTTSFGLRTSAASRKYFNSQKPYSNIATDGLTTN